MAVGAQKAALFDEQLAALQSDLVAEAKRLGFATVGFADAQNDPQMAERLREWLEAGHHGTMDWIAREPSVRAGPQTMMPKARSVIALGASYAPASDPMAEAEPKNHARISVYAQGEDYHVALKKALKALARWLVREAEARGLGEPTLKLFVDTAPVMEKPLAARAGLGWQGKHTNLVSKEEGSWLFLGTVYCTLPFVPDAPHEDHCGSCNACHDACPTDAFPKPYVLDARRCISYLTIEHDGPIPEEFREAIGNRIYGCDDCLAVCPWNKFAESAHSNRAFLPRAELARPRLADLLPLDDAGFRKLFSRSPIKRIGRNRFVRNCLIAAGNSKDQSLLAHVARLQDDPDPVVAEAAEWATARLKAVT